MVSVSDLFFVSVAVVLKLFVVAGVGAAAARQGIFPPFALKSLSQVSATYLIPCLIVFTVGSATNVEVLRESFRMLAGGVTAMAASAIFSKMWGAVALSSVQRDSFMWKIASIASAFPNIVAFPLVVVKTLCEQSSVNGEFAGSSENDTSASERCFATGGAYIFVNSAAWSIIFFTFGVAALKSISLSVPVTVDSSEAAEGSGADVEMTRTRGSETGPQGFDRPSKLSIRLVADNLSEHEFHALKAGGQVSSRAGAAIKSASSSGPPPANAVASDAGFPQAAFKCIKVFFLEPLNVALILGIVIGLIKPLQHALFSADSTSYLRAVGSTIEIMASPVVCLVVLSTGASLAHVDLGKMRLRQQEDLPGATQSQAVGLWETVLSVRGVITGFCASRLVFAPAVLVFLFKVAPGMRPESQLAQLVTLVSSGMPTAQILILLLNKLDLEQSASQLAFLFVFQYSLSLITTTALVAISLSIVNGS